MCLNSPNQTSRVIRFCAWSSPGALLLALAGFVLAGVLPFPLGPDDTTADVVSFYSYGTRVVMGFGMASVGLGSIIPIIAGTSYILWQSPDRPSPYALLQLVSGTVTVVCLMLPMQMMAVAAFRPERAGELTVLLNDLSWLLFITPIAPFVIQNITIGGGILSDRDSLFPHWLGYLNLWVGFTFTFDVVAFAFHSGPMAWNGLLIFWLALTSYSIWLLAMGWGIHVALKKLESQRREGGAL